MKQPIKEIKRMQQLAGIITENQEVNESPMSLSDEATELYDIMLKTGKPFDIDDEGVDAEMERIAKKQFTSMEFPKFYKLNDKQLKLIIPFLKAVIENGYFGMSDKWNGTEIVNDYDLDNGYVPYQVDDEVGRKLYRKYAKADENRAWVKRDAYEKVIPLDILLNITGMSIDELKELATYKDESWSLYVDEANNEVTEFND